MFDTRGFEAEFTSNTHIINGIKYIEPHGWTRYGLDVVDRYGDKSWLHPFDSNNNGLWWRAYHGTINSKDRGRGNCIDAMAKIYKNGFRIGDKPCALGHGVYCSPDPDIIESHGYCGIATVAIANKFVTSDEDGNNDYDKCTLRSFKFMLQVAVRPNKSVLSDKSNDIYWCVVDPNNIRVYGILIKEVPYQTQHDAIKTIEFDSWFEGGVISNLWDNEKIENMRYASTFYETIHGKYIS